MNDYSNFDNDETDILKPCDNIADLDIEYKDWLNRGIANRKISDLKCLKTYGCTNMELYKKFKANTCKNHEDDFNITDIMPSPVTEKYDVAAANDLALKINKSNALQDNDSNVVIINDFNDETSQDNYTVEDLYDKYQRYLGLPHEYRNYSDRYSMEIWGLTVPEMFRYMKEKFSEKDAEEIYSTDDKLLASQLNYTIESTTDPLSKIVNELDCFSIYENRPLCEAVMLEKQGNRLSTVQFDSPVQISNDKVVPFLTPDEYQDNTGKKVIDPYSYLNIKDQKGYLTVIHDLQSKLDAGESVEEELLKLGWNPYVKITGESVKYANDKQHRWLNRLPKIESVDLSNYTTNLTGEELKTTDDKLIPIYIVMACDQNPVVQVSQVGLCFDSLRSVYTYDDGVGCVNRSFYQIRPDQLLDIYAVFVPENLYTTVKDNVTQLINSMAISRIFKSSQDTVNEFVISMINGFNSIIGDDDFESFKYPDGLKAYRLFYGRVSSFKPGELSRKAYAILYCNAEGCTQVENASVISTVRSRLIENLYIDCTDEVLNKYLREAQNLLSPKSILVFSEVKLPFGLDDKGLYINFPKDLQKEYEEAHRLLSMYGTNNLDGIKHELAHLYYINWVIEQKLKHTKKSKPEYKKLIDLRARVLNDFKKYFRIVCNNDPDFDFMAYLKTTEYYTKRMEVDYETLDAIGKIIEKYKKK